MKNNKQMWIMFKYKRFPNSLCSLFFIVSAIFLYACNNGDSLEIENDPGIPFDPNKDLVVTNFEPKSGGLGTRLLIYGDNFGNDVSKVSVTVGGEPAKVISVKGPALLCMVPSKAYEGDVKVAVLNDNKEEIKSAICVDEQGEIVKFDYRYSFIVSTFLGRKYEENTKFDVKEGPFDDCGAFDGIMWMKFDPLNPDHLYWVGGNNKATRLVDFSKKYVSIINTNIIDCRAMDFTPQGDLIIGDYKGTLTTTGLWILRRNPDGTFEPKEALCDVHQITCIAAHPTNGKIYFISRTGGRLWSIDPNTGEGRYTNDDYEVDLLHRNTNTHLVWHPSGNYAYIVYEGKSMISRVSMNSDGSISPPLEIVGRNANHRWIDGVGTDARLWTPRQGVFVKNPDYEGEADDYDFYVTEENSNCIRILSPKGRLSTFAGRGGGIPNKETDQAAGYRDGELRAEAQFNKPKSIAYREEGMAASFYIGDENNNFIRKISPEE